MQLSRRRMLKKTVGLTTATVALVGAVARKPIVTFLKESEKLYKEEELARTTADAEELTRLADSKNDFTRVLVALNPNATSGVLLGLSRDSNPNVIIQVVNNKNTTDEALENVCKSDYLGSDWDFVIRDAARHPNAKPETLDYISKMPTVGVGLEEAKIIVAGRPDAFRTTILRLTKDDDFMVRRAALSALSKRQN